MQLIEVDSKGFLEYVGDLSEPARDVSYACTSVTPGFLNIPQTQTDSFLPYIQKVSRVSQSPPFTYADHPIPLIPT
jgi:hypothetical protein